MLMPVVGQSFHGQFLQMLAPGSRPVDEKNGSQKDPRDQDWWCKFSPKDILFINIFQHNVNLLYINWSDIGEHLDLAVESPRNV